MPTSAAPSSPPASQFAATRWSIVQAAGNWRADSSARRAMDDLARLYWFPLYAYLRRRGNSPSESEDLVQGFFARLLDNDALADVDRSKGKFRSFLLASLKHFSANEWDKRRALKRGGRHEPLSLDALDAETRYAAEPMDDMTPERVFERRWALAVLDHVLARLRHDYAQRGQSHLFTALEHVLVGSDKANYSQIAQHLAMTAPAIKVAAQRLRKRYRELLREEIAQTLTDPTQVEEEIRQLLASL